MERPENNGAVFALPTNLGNRSSRFPHSHRHDYDGIIPKTSRLKDTHSEGKVILFMASALLDHGGGQNPEQATSGPAACEISHHGITGT